MGNVMALAFVLFVICAVILYFLFVFCDERGWIGKFQFLTPILLCLSVMLLFYKVGIIYAAYVLILGLFAGILSARLNKKVDE
jgi:hypothetical protein